MLWFLLIPLASAQVTYAEGDLGVHLPISHISAGPGLRALAETSVTDSQPIYVGGELGVRLPSRISGIVGEQNEQIAGGEGVEYTTRITLWTLGGRAAYHIGAEDALHGRVGAGLGAAALYERTEGVAGKTRERALLPWFRPEGAVLVPVGAGHVTASLLVTIAPRVLEVLGDGPGGTNAAFAGGYRFPL